MVAADFLLLYAPEVSPRVRIIATILAIVGPSSFCRPEASASHGAGRAAETPAESSGEMCVVAKTAGAGDHTERLACLQRGAALQQARSVIQADPR